MKNTIIILLIVMILTWSFTVFLPIKTCAASGDIITVDDSGGADYTTIQDAINAANASGGDTIKVYSGAYNENLLIDKSLTLIGEGSGTKSIIGANSNRNTIVINSGNVIISGFTISNSIGASNHYHCLLLDSISECTITNNIIEDAEYGVWLLNSNSNTIDGNTIKDCFQMGIRLSSSNSNTIKNNNIENNGNGIYLSGSNSNNIFQNTINANNGRGIWLTSSGNTLYKNDFSGNGGDNAFDTSTNTWYDPATEKGNYWDDYDDYDSNDDGTGDTPYDIPGGGGNQDLYPLGDFLQPLPTATIADITPNPAVQGQTVNFYGDYSGSVSSWEWRSDKDGVIDYSKNCQSTSLSVGTHTITFKVTDNLGRSAYDYDTLIIQSQSTSNQLPTATIEKPNPNIKTTYTYGEIVEFRGNGQDSDGFINGYSWSSEPSWISSNEKIFTKNNIPVGEYTIYFQVRDNDGDWSAKKSASIEIITDPLSENQPPVADPGGPYNGYINETIFFDGSNSYDPDNDPLEYSWDFGDGDSGTGQKIGHTYTSVGEYDVTLIVTDKIHGSQAVETTYVTISSQSDNNNNNGGNNGDNGNDAANNKKDEEVEPWVIIIGITLLIFFCIILIFKFII